MQCSAACPQASGSWWGAFSTLRALRPATRAASRQSAAASCLLARPAGAGAGQNVHPAWQRAGSEPPVAHAPGQRGRRPAAAGRRAVRRQLPGGAAAAWPLDEASAAHTQWQRWSAAGGCGHCLQSRGSRAPGLTWPHSLAQDRCGRCPTCLPRWTAPAGTHMHRARPSHSCRQLHTPSVLCAGGPVIRFSHSAAGSSALSLRRTAHVWAACHTIATRRHPGARASSSPGWGDKLQREVAQALRAAAAAWRAGSARGAIQCC
jgi:hypothetical protein